MSKPASVSNITENRFAHAMTHVGRDLHVLSIVNPFDFVDLVVSKAHHLPESPIVAFEIDDDRGVVAFRAIIGSFFFTTMVPNPDAAKGTVTASSMLGIVMKQLSKAKNIALIGGLLTINN